MRFRHTGRDVGQGGDNSVRRFTGPARRISLGPYGVAEGGTRFFVACSNAYAISISFGSLHWAPVKPTPNGAGFALKPAGNGGFGALGTMPNGTTMIG